MNAITIEHIVVTTLHYAVELGLGLITALVLFAIAWVLARGMS